MNFLPKNLSTIRFMNNEVLLDLEMKNNLSRFLSISTLCWTRDEHLSNIFLPYDNDGPIATYLYNNPKFFEILSVGSFLPCDYQTCLSYSMAWSSIKKGKKKFLILSRLMHLYEMIWWFEIPKVLIQMHDFVINWLTKWMNWFWKAFIYFVQIVKRKFMKIPLCLDI